MLREARARRAEPRIAVSQGSWGKGWAWYDDGREKPSASHGGSAMCYLPAKRLAVTLVDCVSAGTSSSPFLSLSSRSNAASMKCRYSWRESLPCGSVVIGGEG